MATKSISGKVARVIRHGHTVYGNPIMSIVLEGDEWGVSHRISDNASIVYEIENPEYREEPHTFALTRAGRISHIIREAVTDHSDPKHGTHEDGTCELCDWCPKCEKVTEYASDACTVCGRRWGYDD